MPINIGQPFKRTSSGPIDMSLTLTKAEMLAVKDSEMPAKYFTICQEDGQVYLYDKSATPSAQTGKFKLLEAGGTESMELTQAEYDALSDDEKMNGTIYFITDGEGGGGGAEIRTYRLDEPFDYQEVSDTVSSGKQVRFITEAGNTIEATFIRTDAEGIYFTGYETNYSHSIIARDGQTTWEVDQKLLIGVAGGGSKGQILAKKSVQAGDTEWVEITGSEVIKSETGIWSGTGRNGQTITFSESIQNFDEIVVYAVKDSSDLYRQWQALIVKTADIVLGKGVIFYVASGDSQKDWVRLVFLTNTTARIESYVYPSSQPDVYNTITRIAGVKYTNPHTYTTTERKIGTFLSKDLYEITLTNITIAAAPSSGQVTWYDLTGNKGVKQGWDIVDYEVLSRIADNTSSATRSVMGGIILRGGGSGNWQLGNQYQSNLYVRALTLRYVKEAL